MPSGVAHLKPPWAFSLPFKVTAALAVGALNTVSAANTAKKVVTVLMIFFVHM